MQIRVIDIKRGGKHYRYAQLVESFRRKSDGMPTHRIVASLGSPDSLEVANLREALAASRKGKTIAVARTSSQLASKLPRPVANLRYLDVAVLRELWTDWRLDDLLHSVMPSNNVGVDPAAVVCALAVQRCVDPGSKLFASRWFPRTALPELLGVAPSSFNNSRIHRVLDDLDAAGPQLQAKLAHACREQGAFVSLFVDVTDTWFVGDGPELATRGKTKEGLIQRKVGIVLLCSERGYPLRWNVVAGNEADGPAMQQMIESIHRLAWASDVPIVMDRAMGKTANIAKMDAMRLRYVTALTRPEFASYSDKIPYESLSELDPCDGHSDEHHEQKAAAAALKAGMLKADDDLYVMDLGIVFRSEPVPESKQQAEAPNPAATAMSRCRQLRRALELSQHPSLTYAARALGMGKAHAFKVLKLARLADSIQQDVLEGRARTCSIADLLKVAAIEDTQEQLQAFEQLLRLREVVPAQRFRPPRSDKAASADSTDTPAKGKRTPKVRAVAYFNPEQFVTQRQHAQQKIRSIERFVSNLNRNLAHPSNQLNRDGIVAAVDRKLRPLDLLTAFDLNITEHSNAARRWFQLDLRLNQDDWQQRRRYDGFSVIVTHPELNIEPHALCRLYRQKDAVEKDFQIIKSFVKLRPVRHRNDGKVRAHVTVCMLTLLLERILEQKLGGITSAACALETLATCQLNQFKADRGSAYVLTHPDAQQKKLLQTLRLEHLADEGEVAEVITPR